MFSKNRIAYLKEWLDFIKLIRLTTNPSLLRSILLSSFTIGIPTYKIDFSLDEDEEVLTIDVTHLEKTNSKLAKIDEMNESTKLNEIMKDEREEDGGGEGGGGGGGTGGDNVIPILLDNKNLEFEDANDFNEVYETLIDDLLDLAADADTVTTTASVNTTEEFNTYPHNDSVNLKLVSRCIQLVDLVNYLSDDHVLGKCMYQLSTKIYEIVIRVSQWFLLF